MPLVPALCTQCGSKLEIDSSQEAAVCPYCHTPFVTEKAGQRTVLYLGEKSCNFSMKKHK